MTAVTACPEYTAARSSEQQKSSCPNRQEPFTAASHVHGTHLGPQISAPYSASVTASSHSLEQASPGTSMARCENQLSAAAPCQCFTSGGMLTTSPGCSFRAGFPHSWYQPRPATQTRICPPPLAAWWMCQLLRQPGSKVTFARKTVFFGSVSGLRKDAPEKYCA